VLCEGEIRADPERRNQFETVRIPLTHAIFQQTSLLPNANTVGIPICKSKYPRSAQYEKAILDYMPNASARNIPNTQDWNPVLRSLEVDCAMESDERSARKFPTPLDVPWVKQFYQGNAVLARTDLKPLYKAHVETLWVFNKHYLEPKQTLASNIHNNDLTLEDVAKQEITREIFAPYCFHMQTFLRSRGEPNVPSPYEVKKRRGTLKRKRPKGSSASSKRGQWEWSSDGDEDDVEKIEDE
jgi:hypothetical protein